MTNQLSDLSKDVAKVSEAIKSYQNEISEMKSMLVEFQDEMKVQVQSLAVTLQQNSSEEAVKRQVLSMFERIHEGLKIAMGPRPTREETTTNGEGGSTREQQSSVPPSATSVPPVPQVVAGADQRPSPTLVPPVTHVAARGKQHPSPTPVPLAPRIVAQRKQRPSPSTPIRPAPQVAAGSSQRPSSTAPPLAPQVVAASNQQRSPYPAIPLQSFYYNLHHFHQHWFGEGPFRRDDGWYIAKLEEKTKRRWRDFMSTAQRYQFSKASRIIKAIKQEADNRGNKDTVDVLMEWNKALIEKKDRFTFSLALTWLVEKGIMEKKKSRGCHKKDD